MNRTTGSAPRVSARERLLAAADELFYEEGFNLVGIDRVIEHAGVAKASLYDCFGSKEELIRSYLQQRHEARQARLRERLALCATPREKILAVFDSMAEAAAKPDFRGCAFVNALAELGSEDSEARKLAVAYKETRRLWYRDLLSRLDVDDPDTLATQLSLLVDGAYAAVLVHQDPAMVRPAIAAARTLLKAAGVAISTGEAKSSAISRAP